MLIRFSVENFLSFRDEVELSMVAGNQRIHPEHKISDEKHGMSLLKATVIYGANASGKSNLIKAMAFAKNLITKGRRPNRSIPLTPFKLDSTYITKPAEFQFEFTHKQKAYIYGFTVTTERIHEEWLYEIKSNTEKAIFERKTDDNGKTIIEFSNIKFKKKKDQEFLEFTAMGTRPNQLFLTESIERDMGYFEDVFYWFDKVLVIIFPESKRNGLEAAFMSDDDFKQGFQDFFQIFDTGIAGIDLQEFNLEEEKTIPPEILNRIRDEISGAKINEGVQVQGPMGRYLFHKNPSNELKSYKFVTVHKGSEANQIVRFNVIEESDGTQRLFDLIPALMELLNDEKIFVVDELDRSLHPHLSRKILEVFLGSKSQSQLIVTTHESSLLDLDLLRRDEIWFIEKDKNGASQIYSLEEFAPRADKDIRKGYLLGRFGAIPVIQNSSIKDWAK